MALANRNITSAKRKYQPSNSELSIIIPAAGMGYRMKSYGPKCLINIYEDKTIIERQIEILWSIYPKAEILVCVGFEAEKVRKSLERYPVRFIYNPLHEKSNVLYSLGLAAQATISKEILIVYGDLIFNEHAVRNLRGDSKVVVDCCGQMGKNEVGLIFNDKSITNFAYGLDSKWAQIAYLTEKELNIFKSISCKEQSSQWLGYEALNYIIDNGGSLQYTRPKLMKIFEIDTPKDLEKIPKNKLTFG